VHFDPTTPVHTQHTTPRHGEHTPVPTDETAVAVEWNNHTVVVYIRL
jgi:hypothetical protein